ncbi:MAG: short chain dehydrogenase [Thalassobium sp.]|uniref:short chain dehydrogenase n=1 Tax=Octadecabacter sp. SW4 TaxID=2602067 RepID=UPI000C0D853A|nr:short chain dehydrogenase [Octadecabacter sp. SW4]PHQ85233.1 MAG: short chain dehydrogenase [Thalassobium sp.]QEE36749.1 short chain dehydrogenase [Octadecabacter sp. SW4]
MKIIIIGATGAVGKTAVQALSARHDIITAGRSSGDINVDLEDCASIQAMYDHVGKVDAVVCATGHGHFGPVADMTPAQCMIGINAKAMAQISLVLEGIGHVSDGGSFTLTSGVLNRDPIRGGAAAAAANGAIDGFVRGAAVDMPRGLRINAVSPEVLEASRAKYDGFFRGHTHVSDEAVALAYSKAVEGCLTGQVFIVD